MASVAADPVVEGEAPARSRRVAHTGLVGAIAVGVLITDQLSKQWALGRLGAPEFSSVEITDWLRLRLTWNTGTAFSIGSGWNLGPFVAVLGLVIVGWLLWSGYTATVPGAVAGGLIAGGAAGNLLDRAVRSGPYGADAGFMGGAVVDFIELDWWPTFNVADSCIVVGAILLLFTSFRAPDPRG